MEESKALNFTVRRRTPELISPAKPTPRELKPLSDIDDQDWLRFQTPLIQFYRRDPKMADRNPATVIREALAKLLVFYYPFAGRLREGPAGKLVVECTGEGVLFIEAEADVRVEELGEVILPPFAYLEELLYDVNGSGDILHSPLMLIQVTRLLCGGFIFAIRINHTMCDGSGMAQFMRALAEMARGSPMPSIPHVWQREMLLARNSPRVTRTHHEYDEVAKTKGTTISSHDMIYRSFFFGPTELSILRNYIPTHLQSFSTYELLSACLWRCRTIALQSDPEEQMRFILSINARAKFKPHLPKGYYGNCIAFPIVLSTARDLFSKPLGHTIELISKAKSYVNDEYMRSFIDLTVIKGRPHFTSINSYFLTDLTNARFNEIDFGWGKAAYGGTAKAINFSGIGNFLIPFTNKRGESEIAVPICLPKPSMEIFVKELDNMLMKNTNIRLLTPKF
ncbi:hypothetical protein L6452_29364 [Arctium lappa]|uniref:Uncharacterized protein n=1 Tax=Arctium lappa TaxID=4217 RepID=A0ACB8ZHK2_ARCLA|nr:hypothetical protein L6452_29364 [Arctium lappa]